MYLRILEILSLLFTIVLFSIGRMISSDAGMTIDNTLYFDNLNTITLFLLILASFCLIVWSYHTRLGLGIGMLMLGLLLRKNTAFVMEQSMLSSNPTHVIDKLPLLGMSLHIEVILWVVNLLLLLLVIYVVLLFLSGSFIRILFGLARESQEDNYREKSRPNVNKYSVKK